MGFQRAELEPSTVLCMRRLSKANVESLLQSYDNEPTASLLVALSIVYETTFIDWPSAVNALDEANFELKKLLNEEIEHLDALVKRLVEDRGL